MARETASGPRFRLLLHLAGGVGGAFIKTGHLPRQSGADGRNTVAAGGFDIYSVVFFDLDGTLVDAAPTITRCWQALFWQFGQRLRSDAEVHVLFGPGESVIFSATFWRSLARGA
ncbi:MAG: hypothetical protein M0Z53_05905 [Thermaerobacter sp.]|nr:hypothetical protein [Thermaerobacter sp.]